MPSFGPIARGVLLSAAVVIILSGLKAASSLLAPFLMGIFVTIIVAPWLFWLMKRGVPEWLSLLIVLVGIGLAGAMLVSLLSSSLAELSAVLPGYSSKLTTLYSQLQGWVAQWNVVLPDANLLQILNPEKLVTMFNHLLNGVSGLIGNALIVFLAVLFLLIEAAHFPNKLRAILVNPEASLPHFKRFVSTVLHYLVLKTVTSAITAACVAGLLWVLGADFIPLWSALAFFLNFIPYVGSAIAAIPAVLMTLIDQGWVVAVWAAAGYIAINILVGQVLETRLIGNKLNLSSFVVFVSLAFWGWVLGPVGMFLSIPLTMLLLIALQSSEATRKYAILLRE